MDKKRFHANIKGKELTDETAAQAKKLLHNDNINNIASITV